MRLVPAVVFSVVASVAGAGCGSATTSRACACEGQGHGAQICEGDDCGPCLCSPGVTPSWDPWFVADFYVDPQSDGDGTASAPWPAIDWDAVDAALADGNVLVRFSSVAADRTSPQIYDERLDVLRTNDGEYRLVLDGRSGFFAGGGWEEDALRRAQVPGVHTGYEDIERHRVTVRGFEVTGSADKGVYWRAGDDVVLEDLVVHDNPGSPAVSLEYSSRSGLPSAGFTVRNSHVFNQRGECIYVGGAEGTGEDSHERVVIEGNLVHHCTHPTSSQRDGINIKDGIGSVTVRRNVVFATSWGIEAASPGLFEDNLVFGTDSNGFHLTDSWGTSQGGTIIRGGAVIGAGERGIRFGADEVGADDVLFEYLTIADSKEAGIVFAAEAGVSGRVHALILTGNQVGMDGWGRLTLEVGTCAVAGNGAPDDRVAEGLLDGCSSEMPALGDLSQPAGPDGVFFTDDDPWRVIESE